MSSSVWPWWSMKHSPLGECSIFGIFASPFSPRRPLDSAMDFFRWFTSCLLGFDGFPPPESHRNSHNFPLHCAPSVPTRSAMKTANPSSNSWHHATIKEVWLDSKNIPNTPPLVGLEDWGYRHIKESFDIILLYSWNICFSVRSYPWWFLCDSWICTWI